MQKSDDFEGHIGCSEYKIQFVNNVLKKYPIKTVAEIGFNAGHSAIIFLNHPRKIQYLKSFDLCDHKYSTETQKYVKNKFKKRWSLVCGNSLKTIPKYQGPKFDLILIDGGHFGKVPYFDIANSLKYLAKRGSYILMDDTFYSYIVSIIKRTEVDKAWNKFIKNHKIKLLASIKGISLGIVL